MTSIRVVPSAELSKSDWSALTDLCVAAFNEPWDDYWESIGPGVHVLAEDPERGIVAHAAVVDRLLYPGDAVLRAGYVEAVAVMPDLQRSGLGTQVMQVINGMLDEAYELGALGTGSQPFYARLGWVSWEGPDLGAAARRASRAHARRGWGDHGSPNAGDASRAGPHPADRG